VGAALVTKVTGVVSALVDDMRVAGIVEPDDTDVDIAPLLSQALGFYTLARVEGGDEDKSRLVAVAVLLAAKMQVEK